VDETGINSAHLHNLRILKKNFTANFNKLNYVLDRFRNSDTSFHIIQMPTVDYIHSFCDHFIGSKKGVTVGVYGVPVCGFYIYFFQFLKLRYYLEILLSVIIWNNFDKDFFTKK